MRCEDADGLIDAYAEDLLDDAAARRSLDEHVGVCARCRNALDASRRLSVSLATLPVATPRAAADARILASVDEEIAWSRRRARARRAAAAVAVAAVVVAGAVVLFVAGPAASIADTYATSMIRVGESWLRLRAAPTLFDARGAVAAALVVLVAVTAIDRAVSRIAAARPAR